MPAYEIVDGRSDDGSKRTRNILITVFGVVVVAAIVVAAAVTNGFKGDNHSSASSGSASLSASLQAARPANVPQYSYEGAAVFPQDDVTVSDSPTTPGFKTASYEKTVTHADGRVSHLSYEVERHADFSSLDQNPKAVKALCKDAELTIVYDSHMAAANHQYKAGSFIGLHKPWNCSTHMRQVLAVNKIEGYTVSYATKNATLLDVYKNARISLKTAAPANPAPTPAGRRRRDWESDLSSFMCKAGSYIDDVVTAAKDIDNLVENGAFSYSGSPWSKDITLPTPDCASLSQGLEGSTGCSATLDLSTSLDIVISDYTLQTFDASISGPLDLTMDASQLGVSDSWTTSKQAQLWKDSFSSMVMVAGVPVPLELYVNVVGGYDVDVDAGLHVSGSVGVTANAKLGFNYEGSSNAVTFVHDLSVSGNPPQFSVNADATGTLTLHLMPVLYLQAAYLGGPTAQPVITTVIGANYNNDGSCGAESVQATVSASASTAVGAKLDVDLPGDSIDHWWKSPTLYNTGMKQLGQWCL
eukprot:m.477037 g.477037  ORF g.477037 m.477037 type:complete len:528 (-) comp20734_c0_seq1:317-1900(-)